MNINDLVLIHNENFKKKVDASYFENILNIKKIYTILDKAYLIVIDSIDVYEIFEIAVKKEYQGLGYGAKLLEMLPKDKNIFLEVNENNEKAINLYKKFDFKKISIRKKYYGDADAIIMMKNWED